MEIPVILGIGTAVPAHVLDQQDTLQRIVQALHNRPDAARWAKRIFARCGVDTRYTCEPNLLESSDRCRYIYSSTGGDLAATEDRMAVYRKESVGLAAAAARKALEDSSIRPGGITHLITVSCTGFFLPGLDTELALKLDLPMDVRRIPLTFLGCAAGLTAIRMSEEIVRKDPDARVLVVTVELCTLHIQPSLEKEDLFAASFFGDGASACVLGSADPEQSGGYALHETREVWFPSSADKMRWTVGNHGFQLHLSSEIPGFIEHSVPPAFQAFWGGRAAPDLWAIHPGGKGIIDALQNAFHLTEEQTRASRSVLRRFGNMSSATILFVLDELRQELRQSPGGRRTGAAVAFGPGISAEIARFTLFP